MNRELSRLVAKEVLAKGECQIVILNMAVLRAVAKDDLV
jgi:hypothetical protein